MVLRLEHVAHKRPEGLRRFDYVRSRRVLLARNVKLPRGLVYGDAVFHQRIHKFCRRGKIGLRRRQDVSSGVALVGIAHHVGVPRRQTVPASAANLRVLLFSLSRRLDGVEHLGMNGPVVAVTALDGVPAHPIDVV